MHDTYAVNRTRQALRDAFEEQRRAETALERAERITDAALEAYEKAVREDERSKA